MLDLEIHCDLDQAQSLIDRHLPQWSALPLSRLASDGTDNSLFRLGDNLILRLPKRPEAAPKIAKEVKALKNMTGLGLLIPEPVVLIEADNECEYPFSVLRWIEGVPATLDQIDDPRDAARRLARFLHRLRGQNTEGGPLAGPENNRRGVALIEMDEVTRKSMVACADEIDLESAQLIWAEALGAEPWQDKPVWLHGDLKADNLLSRDGVLTGVLDFGLAALGDPAADLACAWSYLPNEARQTFFEAIPSREDDWARARGWALYGAVVALSYYRGGKNEALCRTCRATLSALDLRD